MFSFQYVFTVFFLNYVTKDITLCPVNILMIVDKGCSDLKSVVVIDNANEIFDRNTIGATYSV